MGNIKSIENRIDGQTQSFTYDGIDRLTQASVTPTGSIGDYGTQNYTYDLFGRLASKTGVGTYQYDLDDNGNSLGTPIHAVTEIEDAGGATINSYGYDANGNQTTRTIGGTTYNLVYDFENRLIQVEQGGVVTASFVYDGNGNRVKATAGGVTVTYIGNYFEWSGSTTTMLRYYYLGGKRIAMRQGNGTGDTGLTYLLADHLGSTSVTVSPTGTVLSELRYAPWGETVYKPNPDTTPTTFRYTGQREDSYINLYWMGSRWYDPALGRFISPDSIVPSVGEGNNPNAVGYVASTNYSALVVDYHENQFLEQVNQQNRNRFEDPSFKLPGVPTNSLAFDRYSYCFNNPIRYNDPNGHNPALAAVLFFGGFTISAPVLIIGGLLVVGAVVAYDAFAPGKEERHAEINAGLTSLANQATQAANGIQTLFARPRNNDAQNKQFKGAVRQLEWELGRELLPEEVQQLHRALHDLEDPGFWDIVEQGHKEFDKPTQENDEDGE